MPSLHVIRYTFSTGDEGSKSLSPDIARDTSLATVREQLTAQTIMRASDLFADSEDALVPKATEATVTLQDIVTVGPFRCHWQ
jgi:hypothetical protein